MRLRLLGKSGLRVSELCLGTMTFGDDWGWGADKATSRRIFERFAEAGGNFIDTSNNYTNGTSEQIVGECIHAERDRFVVATKYTLRLTTGNANDANLGGNSRKSMHRSVENSLRRLNTDYIDMLYLHMWDYVTPVEEVLRGVDDLIRVGKVLYFSFSDTPAWVVSYAIAKAEDFGWTRPLGIQIPYSLFDRDVERDILPMAREHDLAILPWGMLESGALTGKYSTASDEPRRESRVSERVLAAGECVVKLAREIGRTPAQVAINWVRQQPGNVIPILGCRTEKQLEDNLGCLDFRLTDEQMAELEKVAAFKIGFPASFLHSNHVRGMIFGDTFARLDHHRMI
ncbi:MAG TPA: aldo/keto reductase [Oceanobacillus sp.]|nr:aldo/keto reductase [Oceanobacillus sp.]